MKTPEQMAEEYANSTDSCDVDQEYAFAYKGFFAGYKAAQQWISVKDYYPIPTNDNCDCKLVAIKAANGYVFDVADTAHGCLWADKLGENVEHETHEVTHWMELPAPPKEEKLITSLDQVHRPQKRISVEEAREMFPDKPPKEEK